MNPRRRNHSIWQSKKFVGYMEQHTLDTPCLFLITYQENKIKKLKKPNLYNFDNNSGSWSMPISMSHNPCPWKP